VKYLTILTDITALSVFVVFCDRFYKLVKDFCGVVSEASVRSNLILVMELLNEYLVGSFVHFPTLKIDDRELPWMAIFSVQQHICYSMLYAIARPSVCLSHRWISQKRFKLGSCNFHHWVAPWL